MKLLPGSIPDDNGRGERGEEGFWPDVNVNSATYMHRYNVLLMRALSF
jgi:hypothetical protein